MDSVVNFDIPYDDEKRAHKFYSELFGWTLAKAPDIAGAPYSLATTVETDEHNMPRTPGAINGGLKQRSAPEEVPTIVIKVADIEETLARVEEAGGRIAMGVQQVGTFGFTARVIDSEANIIGIWQDIR
jgi:uncharacterized protein